MPDLSTIPRAVPAPVETPTDHAILESDTQSQHGDIYQLSGDALITFRDRQLRADLVTYDKSTGDVTLQGHVRITGGENNESIEATHGIYNLHSQTGTFYDVKGSVGIAPQPGVARSFTTTNPFLFTGKKVVESAPGHYEVFEGSVTSCQLPNPDWQLFGRHIEVDQKIARMYNANFRLLGVPLLFLPYVTHPVNAEQRQSGILIPVFNYSKSNGTSPSKGLKVGEEYFLVLGRSADMTLGLVYYSERGFAENGTFRYKGRGEDFFNAHFSALQDRGFYSTYTIPGATSTAPTTTGTLYTNQGGEDVTAAFKYQLDPTVRAVGDAEYLSSYIYREAFTENFNQAVSSDILSTLYLVKQENGYSADVRADRYQGEKVVPVGTNAGSQIKIFHAPSIDFTALDHPLAHTPLLWSMSASAAGLKRSQTNFETSGITERLDFQPQIGLPLSGKGWHTMTSVAVRDTFYSRSRQVPYNLATGVNGPNATPIEVDATLNRSSVDLTVDIRPPAVEKDFTVPERWQRLFGTEGRHTIEPEITYRNVHGIDNFLAILRFDDDDLAADTDQLRYGVVQHLYFRPRPKPVKAAAPKPGCPAVEDKAAPEPDDEDETADPLNPDQRSSNDANGIPDIAGTAPDIPVRTHRHDPCAQPKVPQPQQEWFSWRVEQEHYFAQNFGGAVIDGRRNIFDSTLDFSGIAFLTEARSTSPLISRMRFRTSSHSDFEWDFDYDTGASKFTSQNVFMDAHEGNIFGGVSYAYLNAPGRFHIPNISSVTNLVTGLTNSAVSDFSQMRFLIGYGAPTRPGLSAAAGGGIDVDLLSMQYLTLQSSYNWNCCGLSIEYRRYNLGTVRDEGTYSFNFTLANIGSAGNIRRAQALF